MGSGVSASCIPSLSKCTDSLDEERLARASHPAEKHVQWFEVRTTALLFS
jgi:hypothetical protein